MLRHKPDVKDAEKRKHKWKPCGRCSLIYKISVMILLSNQMVYFASRPPAHNNIVNSRDWPAEIHYLSVSHKTVDFFYLMY